jgi:enoyl-CoA hydratase/carnithine racemase
LTFEQLLVSEPAADILQITLNRPRRFNALGRALLGELTAALRDFHQSLHRVLILTGSGRAFCFGADFEEFQDRSSLPAMLDAFQNVIRGIHDCPKITIASLNGFATGAGMDLALACDFRIAAQRAKLGEAYVSMGLAPDGGGSYFLPRMIGHSRALQMLATGEAIDATEARTLGIVNLVCPGEQLAAQTLAFAQPLSTKPQTAIRLIKTLLRQNASASLDTALRNERAAQLRCFEDPEHLEIVKQKLKDK